MCCRCRYSRGHSLNRTALVSPFAESIVSALNFVAVFEAAVAGAATGAAAAPAGAAAVAMPVGDAAVAALADLFFGVLCLTYLTPAKCAKSFIVIA